MIMETLLFYYWDFPLYYLLIATAFCVVVMTVVGWAAMVAREKENDCTTSMIEQLLPEIMTEVLTNYMDYASLCRLSMTNSLMRKTTNTDYVWKALYHKDFWVEQDDAVGNGWKAYYAATRAIVNLSVEFHNIIRQRNHSLMREMWLNADYVKCIQSPGLFNSGYDAVMRCFERGFRYAVENNIQPSEVEKHEFIRARVMKEVAWVVVKTFKQGDPQLFRDSFIFENHNGRWYMVLHQSSIDDEIYE